MSIKISGNYSISIHLSNGEEVFEKKFSIIKMTQFQLKFRYQNQILLKILIQIKKLKLTILHVKTVLKLFNSSSSLKMIIIKNNNWLNSQIIEKPKYIFLIN